MATLTLGSSNQKKRKSRWNKPKPETWKCNIAKKMRSEGLPYTTRCGERPAKVPKTIHCKCRYRCSDHFSKEDQIESCRIFWAFDYNRQKDFIVKSVKIIPPARRFVKASKPRSESRQYFLQNSKGEFRVCSSFFQATLCISNGPINKALSAITTSGTFGGLDKRGRKPPPNKIQPIEMDFVKEHINSFPTVESHYTRKNSEKKYLPSDLNISSMYRLYKEWCESKNINIVSIHQYRKIFCTEFNYSFFVPKKDQCMLCSKYNLAKKENRLGEDLEECYNAHMERKTVCQEAKSKDKQRAELDSNFQTFTFDLQKVMQLPTSAVSQFYYSRKISVYNLTFFESKNKEGSCFFWNEINGKRGSNEIGSIIMKFISMLPPGIKEISLFSDTCSGQNRNQQVVAALLYTVVKSSHLEVIEHKFLESGHSYMECDSMHSTIERKMKNQEIFIMNDYKRIFEGARTGKSTTPYKCFELKYTDFLDLGNLSSKIIKNKKTDTGGNKVNWLKIKCFKFLKTEPHKIFYKYSHKDDYNALDINSSSNRGRPRSYDNCFPPLVPAYSAQLQVNKAKKKDLIQLCDKGIIPEEVQQWYRNIPSLETSDERAPEPCIDDTSDEEWTQE